jgi:predicted aspartyl protease
MHPTGFALVAAVLLACPIPPAAASDLPESPTVEGEALFEAGSFVAAAEQFSEAMALDDMDAQAAMRLGEIALYSNRLDDARRWLRAAIAMRPEWPQPRVLLAETYYRLNDFANASAELRAAGPNPIASMQNFLTLNLPKLESFGATRPYVLRGSGDITRLPFVRTDPLPLVRVRVNGGEEVVFFIDTGGGEVILDSAFANELGIEQFPTTVQGTFAGGKSAPIGAGRIDSIALGDWTVGNLPVQIIDTRVFSDILGARIDGAIGTVILSRFVSTLDYSRGELVLSRTAAPEIPPGAVTMPFWLTGDHYMVSYGTVNDLPPQLFFIDTGLTDAGVNLRRQVIDEAGIVLDESKASQALGAGGAMTSIPYTVRTVTLGGWSEENVAGVFDGPLSSEDHFGFYVQGLVGHEFFDGHRVTFDFERMRIIVAP